MTDHIIIIAVITLTCFGCAVTLTWAVRELAIRYGWTSAPSSSRHIHKRPIPRLGGIAIFCVFLFAWGAHPTHLNLPASVIAVAALMFGVGLFDDLFGLRAIIKLAFQIICGSALFVLGLPLSEHSVLLWGHEVGDLVWFCATVAWVVLISNAVNLIDGLDGLAGGSVLFSTAALGMICFAAGRVDVVLACAAIFGAVLGFLVFNFNPATIFLGDSGSLFLGFMLSALSIHWRDRQASMLFTIAVPVFILAFPLAETSLSILRRFLSGRPLFGADREHIHHKLLDRGLTHRQAVFVLYGACFLAAVGSIALSKADPLTSAVLLIVFATAATVACVALGYVEFAELARIVRRAYEQRRVIANDVVLRKAAIEFTEISDYGVLCRALRQMLEQSDFDGFELVLSRGSNLARCVTCKAAPFLWRSGAAALGAPYWTMSIDLTSDSHGKLGWFRVFRTLERGNLLVDVNVLLTHFRLGVTTALERCLEQCERDESNALYKACDRTCQESSGQGLVISSQAVVSSGLESRSYGVRADQRV